VNHARNGLATFLCDDTRVSSLHVQVVQETAPWSDVDLWGRFEMTYAPGPVPDEATARAAFAEELQHRTPIRPWSALPASPALEAFDGDPAPEDISANGLVVDGVLYLRGCRTRYGDYRGGIRTSGRIDLSPEVLREKWQDHLFRRARRDHNDSPRHQAPKPLVS
jgi:hypothetical protein